MEVRDHGVWRSMEDNKSYLSLLKKANVRGNHVKYHDPGISGALLAEAR